MKHDPADVLRRALTENEALLLEDLADWAAPSRLNSFREEIRNVELSFDELNLLYGWMWHPLPAVSRLARIVVLFLGDAAVRTSVLLRLEAEDRDVPFEISYVNSGREYIVDLPGVPGWGITEYAETPQADALLRVLGNLLRRASS